MAKRNKIRYMVKEKPKVQITVTGNIFLQHRDDEESLHAQKGDLLVYPQNEALNSTYLGEYDRTGFSGYFKVDISDGKNWQPLLIGGIFSNNENHFGKSERPIDTYNLCCEILREYNGKNVTRSYREHYEPEL